ncbi:MAG: histidine phosphatase family protein [Caulobacteraceae bacterium]|nr:histidine phosphatase family protein [Caulobacteraceae bacterium]
MRHLILLRHAKAESVSSSGRDFDRALTARGHRDAAIMGRALAQAGFTPQRVLASSARRAQETWEGAAPSFPGAQVESLRTLYLAPAEFLDQTAQAIADVGSLMIVGHNPGLHDFAIALAGGEAEGLLASFPTAAAVVFAKPDDGPFQLVRVLTPRDHGGGSL